MTNRTYRGATFGALALAVLAVTALVAPIGCSDDDTSRESEPRVTQLPEPEDAIDEPLMLSLAQAKNFHHQAKVYMADGNLPEAIAAVEQILSIAFPPGAPEGEDVRLDAHAMLAKLQLASDDLDGAMKTVDLGIAAATRQSFFLANLHTVRGEVFEARAEKIDAEKAADAKARAKAARYEAIKAFEHSNDIIEPLQKSLYERIKEEQR